MSPATKTLSIIVGALFIAALVTTSSARAHGHKLHFANESIRGSWGFHAYGNQTNRGVSIVAVGRIIYDGVGECEVRDTINIDWLGAGFPPLPAEGISRVSSACTYHVNPDGSGRVLIVFPPPVAPDTVHLSFVIEKSGSFMRLIRTDDVAIAQGTSQRQLDGPGEEEDF